jgi:hypothetical protein
MGPIFPRDVGSKAFAASTVDKQPKAKTIKHGTRMSPSIHALIRHYLAPTEIVGVSGAL